MPEILLNQIPVSIQFWDSPATEGVAIVQENSRAKRIAEGVKKLAIFWALALVSVFIPLAHFILVPGFLIAGLDAPGRKSRGFGQTAGFMGVFGCGVGKVLAVGWGRRINAVGLLIE